MKRSKFVLTLSMIFALTMTSCTGLLTTTTVDGGPGWYAGDYAPYYWSDYNGVPPGTPPPPAKPEHKPDKPGKPNGGDHKPGGEIKPNAPSKPGGGGAGRNPGSPSQGGFRGGK